MAKGPKPVPPEVRFWRFVQKSDGCWLWIGGTNGRYGTFAVDTRRSSPRRVYAHRFSYEIHHGNIPAGMVINHLCAIPLCVNPAHLEVATYSENSRYGEGPAARKARQTHCIHGHPLDKVKPNGTRRCTICPRLRERRKRELRRQT